MRLWAFATSRDGLGLTSEQFWALSVREFNALKRVHRDTLIRWAIDRAQFMNAHFVKAGEEPWLPADFLGEGNRETRNDEKQLSLIAAAQVNAELAKIKKGDPPPEGLPSWATGVYG